MQKKHDINVAWNVKVALALLALLFGLPIVLIAQTTVHSGKVIVRSTAAQGVCVGGNANASPTTCTGDVETQTVTTKGPSPEISFLDTDGTKTFNLIAGTDILTLQDKNDASPRIQLQHSLDRIFLTAGDVQITSNSGTAGLNMANSGIVFQNAASSSNGASIGAASNLLILSTATGGMQINNQNNTVALFSMGNTGVAGWNNQVRFVTGTGGAPGIADQATGTTGFTLGGGNIGMSFSGASALSFSPSGVTALAFDNGALAGRRFYIGRNNNVTTPAAGTLIMEERDGTVPYIWVDATDQLRIHLVAPESAGDTAGTVVGTQTSTRAAKNILRRNTNTRGALDTIVRTPVYDFTYKNGAYNGQRFTGITTEDSPAFGMDNGKSFNAVSAFGTAVLAMQEMQKQIDTLKAEVAALKRERRRR